MLKGEENIDPLLIVIIIAILIVIITTLILSKYYKTPKLKYVPSIIILVIGLLLFIKSYFFPTSINDLRFIILAFINFIVGISCLLLLFLIGLIIKLKR